MRTCKGLALVQICRHWHMKCIVSAQPPETANPNEVKTDGSQETDQKVEEGQEGAERPDPDEILEVIDE